ncbi:MAG: carboxypeptidase regulatory-like domain-containing protein [Bacteroidetes bacterium]|nr:carboxypeptidase regulatory-like domain-containing protein [Bacteroidota bacterium]
MNTIFPTVTVTGTVVESGTNNPIPNATVYFENTQNNNSTTTDASGQFTIPGFFQGVYNLTIGNWGHRTYCSSNQNVTGGNPYNISLDKGYYDDFVLDFGWTVSGPSGNLWERGAPIATTNQGQTANPGADVSADCGTWAFVTDNGGGGAWDNDVDQGSTILTSPIFDVSTLLNPHVNYYRWFYNGGTTNGQPDDSMKVYLTDGTNTVLIEALGPNGSSSQWNFQSIPINSFLTANSTMQLIVNVGDPGPIFNIVEGGLDKFEIVDVVGLNDHSIDQIGLMASPNPFNHQVSLSIYSLEQKSALQIFDMSGRLIEERIISSLGNQNVQLGEKWTNGVYMARLVSGENISSAIKLVKK